MKKFKAHILIVDDDDRIRELVRQYLLDNKYIVTTASDAFDAENKIEITIIVEKWSGYFFFVPTR